MDGSVEHAKESGMATRCELNTPPYSGWHDAVVDDMQVGDLVELFAKHKEDSIQEFCEFAEVIPPAQFCNDQFVRIIGVINWLAGQTVTSQPSMLEYLSLQNRLDNLRYKTMCIIYLVDQINAEDHLNNVVPYDGFTKFKRLAILHQPRPQGLDEIHVYTHKNHSGHGWTHQQPSINTSICIHKQRVEIITGFPILGSLYYAIPVLPVPPFHLTNHINDVFHSSSLISRQLIHDQVDHEYETSISLVCHFFPGEPIVALPVSTCKGSSTRVSARAHFHVSRVWSQMANYQGESGNSRVHFLWEQHAIDLSSLTLSSSEPSASRCLPFVTG